MTLGVLIFAVQQFFGGIELCMTCFAWVGTANDVI